MKVADAVRVARVATSAGCIRKQLVEHIGGKVRSGGGGYDGSGCGNGGFKGSGIRSWSSGVSQTHTHSSRACSCVILFISSTHTHMHTCT
jgi:hypothetical protein